MASAMQMPLPMNDNSVLIPDARRRLRQVMSILEALIGKTEKIEIDLARMENSRVGVVGRIRTTSVVPFSYNLDIQARYDDSIAVSFDGGAKIILGPRLASVFMFLAIASGGSAGNGGGTMAGWRSRSEILDYLEQSAKKKFRISYVNNVIHLLRAKLIKAGYDPRIIQTHREKGVRLAIKCGDRNLQKFPSVARLLANQESEK